MSGPADTPDLLRSKLLPPRVAAGPWRRAPLVARPALLAQLEAGRHCKLTLISAPAGFGKTTLASQWLAHGIAAHQAGGAPAAAWLALDSDDNDPLRFWRYVIAACQTLHPWFGASAMALLNAPRQADALPKGPAGRPELALLPPLTALINAMAELPAPAILVLEDYHAIEAVEIHASLAFVLDHLPAPLHLMIVTRADPPLPLYRLRAGGELCEVRADDLRFSPGETADFMAQALPFALPPAALARLDERTEGWAVGLRLAALSLRGHGDPAAVAQALAGPDPLGVGSQRTIDEYLIAEVLDAQPPDRREFLLATSILDRLSAPLCDAVSQRNDGAASLAQIEQEGLFLTPLDGAEGWYRYHALFAEAVRRAALERCADRLADWHERASAWYERERMPAEAIESALEAGDWPRAVGLIEDLLNTQMLFDPREPRRLRRWLERLPAEILHRHPLLCFSFPFALLRTSGGPAGAIVDQLEVWIDRAEAGWRAADDRSRLGEIYGARTLLALWRRRFDQATVHARQALEWLPAGDTIWRGICLGFVGRGEFVAGRLAAAHTILQEAWALSEASGTRPATRAHLLMLGQVLDGQAEPHQAAALYRQALADAIDHSDRSDQAPARLGLARLAYEWNTLAEAAAEAQAALDLGRDLPNEALKVEAALLLARIDHVGRAVPETSARLAELLAGYPPGRWPLLYRTVLAAQARQSLDAGDLAAAKRAIGARDQTDADLPPPLLELETLVDVRLLLAGQPVPDVAAALDRLAGARQAAQAAGRTRRLIEIDVLAARAYRAAGLPDAAQAALRAALLPALAPNARRVFIDEGAPIAEILRQLIAAPAKGSPEPRRAFAQALVREIVAEQARPELAEPLSKQERRVLGLLAGGRSNPEIAAELVVSINTIKTQLKQIYRKLGAASREEAATLARRLDLA